MFRLEHPLLVTLLAAALAAAAGDAAADTLRCGNSLIDTGMIAAEVVAKCGEPESRDVATQPIRARRPNGSTYVVGTTTIERWVYERGWGRFPAHLTFEQGKLKEIELQYHR